MALFSNPQGEERPRENQYLQANPATQPNANTSWMSPSSGDSGSPGVSNIAQSQPNPPSQVSNGTMLGSIAQGNQVGHDGTFNGMNREQWRDKWMSSGRMSQDEMQRKLTEMGATNAGRGDIWTTPFGETYDLGIGYKTGNPMAAWTPVSGAQNQIQNQASMLGTPQAQGGGMLNGGMMQQIMQMLQSQGGMQQQSVPQQSNYFQNMQQQPTRNNDLIQGYLGGGNPVTNKYGGITGGLLGGQF